MSYPMALSPPRCGGEGMNRYCLCCKHCKYSQYDSSLYCPLSNQERFLDSEEDHCEKSYESRPEPDLSHCKAVLKMLGVEVEE